MKTNSKILLGLAASALLSQAALVWADSQNPGDYSVVALKDCQVMSNSAMTAEQLDAYLKLKAQEQKMRALEIPVAEIEQEAKQYTDEMQKFAKLAIQDTEQSLHIDKAKMQQHKKVAEKFQQFMQKHQAKFDAIGQQGQLIGQYAQSFENSIKESLQGIDYDQIQVLTPDSKHTEPGCSQDTRILII